MFTKEEASALRQKFWTAFGKYMQPVPSASGEKVNWINLKTGIKGINLKLVTENKFCLVAVIIRGDEETREQYYKIFQQLDFSFSAETILQQYSFDENGEDVSRISIELNDKTIFRESDWPEIIGFFKTQLILFDAFWTENKFVFEMS